MHICPGTKVPIWMGNPLLNVSGKETVCELENGDLDIVDLPVQNGGVKFHKSNIKTYEIWIRLVIQSWTPHQTLQHPTYFCPPKTWDCQLSGAINPWVSQAILAIPPIPPIPATTPASSIAKTTRILGAQEDAFNCCRVVKIMKSWLCRHRQIIPGNNSPLGMM